MSRPARSFLLSPLIGALLALACTAQAGDDSALQFPRLRKQFDQRSNVIWYIPESAPAVVDTPAFYVYFGRGDAGKLTALRLKVVYRGKLALGIRRYWAVADGKPLRSFPNAKWHVEQVLNVWEWIDEPIPAPVQLHDLATLAHAKVAVMHFEGSGGKYQMTLSAEQKQAIKDVIKAYGASGGSLG